MDAWTRRRFLAAGGVIAAAVVGLSAASPDAGDAGRSEGAGGASLATVVPFYGVAAGLLFVFLHGVTLVGASIYGLRPFPTLVAVALTVPVVLLSTVGAFWGFVSPVESFDITEKLSPATLEDRHPALSAGDIAAHPGTKPFGEPNAPLESLLLTRR